MLRKFEISESLAIALAFSPDGQAIAVGSMRDRPRRGNIRIFRLQGRHELPVIEAPCPWVEALCSTPDTRRIAAGPGDTSIVLWGARLAD